MENKIKLVMDKDKSIKISFNDEVKLNISESKREISAQEIYELLDYEYGDTYVVISENEKKIDKPVLDYFSELFEDICKGINEMDVNEEDDILKRETD